MCEREGVGWGEDLAYLRIWRFQFAEMVGQHRDALSVSLVEACVKTFRDDTIRWTRQENTPARRSHLQRTCFGSHNRADRSRRHT